MPVPAKVLTDSGVEVSETGLKISDPENFSMEKFLETARFLGAIGRAYPFWIGDLLNEGRDLFGEDFAQVEAILPHSKHTLVNYSSVAERIPRTRRRPKLSFGVHETVAYLPPRERDEWLDKAELYDWKRDEIRAARQEAREISGSVDEVVLTGKNERLGQAGLAHEERSQEILGVPAVNRGEPVPSPKVCPECGRPYDDIEGGRDGSDTRAC